ncbi:MAG: DUF1801 domain-containing protein [Gammaproteobacteria bacterium]|nr:DUF1801 domain-containing protein [Gammaproteobacteria bacterium]MYF37682.1 DUF1801 domain-containing protein [Gammaproteobacteria bacterium]
MNENKTLPNDASVDDFLASITDDKKRLDTQEIMDMMAEVTGSPPMMWGSSIIGFGAYRYHYRSGRQGEWALVSVSPRARNVTVYIMPGFSDFEHLMNKLGKYKTGRSCLYLNKLEDVDRAVLYELIKESVAYMKTKYDTFEPSLTSD